MLHDDSESDDPVSSALRAHSAILNSGGWFPETSSHQPGCNCFVIFYICTQQNKSGYILLRQHPPSPSLIYGSKSYGFNFPLVTYIILELNSALQI